MVSLLTETESLLPALLAEDDNMRALATVAARLQQKRVDMVTVYDLSNVDAKFLPYLAEQKNVLGVKGWQFCKNDTERRALLARADELNSFIGTPWAIEEVLSVFNAGGVVMEWWQYDGEPYHFKVDVVLGEDGFTAQQAADTLALIAAYKNVRSILDGVGVRLPDFVAPIFMSTGTTLTYSASSHLNINAQLGIQATGYVQWML